MFLRPTSLLTRLSAIVIGSIWAAAGGFWTYQVLVHDAEFPSRRSRGICFVILCAGVMMVIEA